MGKELARAAPMGPAITATVLAAPAIGAQAIAERRAKLNRWRSGLLYGYFAIIALAFVARGARNLVERGRKIPLDLFRTTDGRGGGKHFPLVLL